MFGVVVVVVFGYVFGLLLSGLVVIFGVVVVIFGFVF